MLGANNDLGAALFRSWSEKQRKDEIRKLVEGFRNGVPLEILCKMSETIAGDKINARKYLKKFMSESERKAAVEAASGSMATLVKSFLL